MAIEMICRGCARKLRVPDEHAGKQARCPQCGTIVPIPQLAGSPVSSEPTPVPSFSSPAAADSGGLGSASPAASGERYLFETEDGKRYGPVTRAELDKWAREGRISPRARLQREGSLEWIGAGQLFPELLTTSPFGGGANPFADRPAPGFAAPGAAMPFGAAGGYLRPHRGGLILGLAIAGFLVCNILGVVAWIMGREDLKQMRAGVMDPSGQGTTQAGTIIGAVVTVLTLLWIGFIVVMIAIGAMS